MPEDGFPVEVISGVPVVSAPEEIDITNADALRAALVQAAGDGHRRFVVDMTRTRFCDSAGLHTLLAAHRRAVAEDRQLLLVVSGDAVPRILALTGIDQIIPSFTGLDEAIGHTAEARAPRAPAHDGQLLPSRSVQRPARDCLRVAGG
jgi:anti-sigma B factor antagonist